MSNKIWKDNSIQFPRLLAEIGSLIDSGQLWEELKESMDINDIELNELFDRAEIEWQKIKNIHT